MEKTSAEHVMVKLVVVCGDKAIFEEKVNAEINKMLHNYDFANILDIKYAMSTDDKDITHTAMIIFEVQCINAFKDKKKK